jgi:hypothetical protein
VLSADARERARRPDAGVRARGLLLRNVRTPVQTSARANTIDVTPADKKHDLFRRVQHEQRPSGHLQLRVQTEIIRKSSPLPVLI